MFEEILSQVKPGTPYLGWFPDDVAGEFSGVELTSRYGVYVLAADWFNNLTVFSGAQADRVAAGDRPRVKPGLEKKIYVTLIYSEGDNLQYNQHRMRVLWDDPESGESAPQLDVEPVAPGRRASHPQLLPRDCHGE